MKNTVLSFCAFFVCSCSKTKSITQPAYAIGHINYYASEPYPPVVNYYFIVDGAKFNNQYSHGKRTVPAHESYNGGDKFMVQYEKSNPGDISLNRMLFSYKVMNDSIDSARYVAEFLLHPPQ